ncbi:hypothetical protein GCM10009608_33370 [Pseudonocardia alaniniphila]
MRAPRIKLTPEEWSGNEEQRDACKDGCPNTAGSCDDTAELCAAGLGAPYYGEIAGGDPS